MEGGMMERRKQQRVGAMVGGKEGGLMVGGEGSADVEGKKVIKWM